MQRKALEAYARALEWADDAACIPHQELDWVPGAYREDRNIAEILELLEICGGCPVRVPCLSYAYSTNSEGILGGSRTRDRTALVPNRSGYVTEPHHGERWAPDDAYRRAIPAAVEQLEREFPKRLADLRAQVEARRADCIVCGSAFARRSNKHRRCDACRGKPDPNRPPPPSARRPKKGKAPAT